MKKPSSKKPSSKRVSVYANLSSRRKTKRENKARRKAEYLASLPKHPLKRILYRMHPKRFFAYWFSREGAFMALKLTGIGIGVITLILGTLFIYYQRELDSIRPDEIAKRVQSTVTKYYDRNDVLLWEDKGDGTYKLVVKSQDIATAMKQATVAIEDKDFYKHGGFSIFGITRATWANLTGSGSSIQGGSTLTQQLIKQIFFADEAGNRGISGVPRKIKEVMLAVQVEGMYDKDQILTMYLNESPYGGRRNGVESAAQTYFGKSAKDISLAEAALLASIPQNPTLYNPYNTNGREALLNRKNTVLTYMAEQGYITKAQADEAKQVAVLDTIKPEADQYKDVKAPHFVQMVKTELEAELGTKTVGGGGLSVKTTLDYRAQEVVDKYVNELFASNLPRTYNFDNGAATMVDTQTGQILAMRGSRDYSYAGYGAVNYATAYIQPGSTIKPLVYAALFKGNYSPGSILSDDPLPQSIYRTDSGQSVQNFDNQFLGNITIRSALARSRNIPAIKAMYVAGRDATINTIHDMGNISYCTQGVETSVGLAAAIGGCGTKQTEHTNAFATIARMGAYKPVASVLEVKNAQGQVIKQWKDSSKQVIDPQIMYEIADIMTDNVARTPAVGPNSPGFLPGDGVKIGAKTGTSNDGVTGKPKDFWFVSYSPKVALSLWVGNHDTKPIAGYSTILGPTNGKIMHDVHIDVFAKDGSWKANDWFTQPSGIKKLTIAGKSDIYPSWYNQSKTGETEKMVFDKVSKAKATDCTPANAKVDIAVQYSTDPVTKKKTYMTTEGYDPNATDTIHNCSDQKPFVYNVSVTAEGKVTFSVTQGTHALESIKIVSGGTTVATVNLSSSAIDYPVSYTPSTPGVQSITVTANDTALYSSEPVSATSPN